MGLSSNSIIHFTPKKSALLGILKENFKLKFCREEIKFTTSTLPLSVPMVSFCDIPLSQIKDHIDKYGEYGIGLTKEWAARNKLNPVMYLQAGSLLAESLLRVLIKYREERRSITEEDEAHVNIARYSKNYEGDVNRRRGKNINDYRYSDEREWRYVPPVSDLPFLVLSDAQISDSALKKEVDVKISQFRLKFEPDDIRYIIIKDETEIGEFLEHLRNAKGKTYPQRTIERLSTRILTTSQIKTDF